MNDESTGIITTLHPKGSVNDIQNPPVMERVMVRPDVNYRISILSVIIPLLVCLILCWWSIFSLLGLCVYTMIRLRGIIIWCIRVYQRQAPEQLRLSCVFVPSCSEYAILSIEKYGVIRGCIKGMNRLARCRYPNGGEDYP